MEIRIESSLGDRAGLISLEVSPVRVAEEEPALVEEIRATSDRLRETHGGKPPSEIPGTGSARAVYRALGIDPTKTRPSSEALLRRVLKGMPFPRVNTLVDCVNLLSLRFLLPYGLYDLDTIRPPFEFRVGGPGDGYAGIRKDRVNLEGRPALFDADGPFGNPTSDSDRAKIRLSTRSALVVCFIPPDMPEGERGRIAEETREVIRRFCGPGEG